MQYNRNNEEAACQAKQDKYLAGAPTGKSHVDRFLDASDQVYQIVRKLNRMISDIKGPQPELAGNTAEKVGRAPSLLEVLENTPDNIMQSCEAAAKAIEELRVLLRI